MTRNRASDIRRAATRAVTPDRNSERQARARGRRESIESFVVVFLGFLVWSIEAEGFVIPTGSMAPTLMGRHKEIECPQCHYVFRVNADREVDLTGRNPAGEHRVHSGTCENCRFTAIVRDEPSFSGDRVYVLKNGVSTELPPENGRAALKRWDVAVFKLPEEPEVRYIKRLVGMPGDFLRIQGGDLWRKPSDGASFERLRRSLDHQRAMAVTVYDDSHRPARFANDQSWQRWAPERAGDWTEPAPARYAPASESKDWLELGYRHLVPTPAQWTAAMNGQPPGPPLATLITDFSSYNTDLTAEDVDRPGQAARAWFHPHWVGDLILSCQVDIQQPRGKLRLELIKAGVSNRCEIDLATGEATLAHGRERLGPGARTGVDRRGTFRLVFANVDDRLTLWVNDVPVFGDGLGYEADSPTPAPSADDLRPARVAAMGAAFVLDQLVLERDAYYTIDPATADLDGLDSVAQYDSDEFFRLLSNPARYGGLAYREPRDYPLAAGHYLMLGDNSPWSRDGRAWNRSDQIDPDRPGRGWDQSGRSSWEVPERLLIGKAFSVYWPHPKPIWPAVPFGVDLRLPAIPYFARMRFIR